VSDQRGKVLSFGPFELSIRDRLLTNGAKVVSLGARAMDLLIVLVEQANTVVGRRTLIERVWPKRGTEQVGPRVQISPLLRALDRSDPGRRWALRGLWHMPDRIIGRERFDVVCGHCRLVCAVLRSWLQVLAFSFKPKAASCRML
jgi:hypothetical protein